MFSTAFLSEYRSLLPRGLPNFVHHIPHSALRALLLNIFHSPMYNTAIVERRKRNTISGKAALVCESLKDWKSALRSLSRVSSIAIFGIQIVVFSVLCLLYLAFSNKYVTQGYVVNKLEAEREHLIIQNEVANRRMEEAKSLSVIREFSDKEMVFASNRTYLETYDTRVAVAR